MHRVMISNNTFILPVITMTCALFPLLSKTSLWTKTIKTQNKIEWIDALTTAAPKATTTVKTIQTTSTIHPTTTHGTKNESMKSIEHHSSNIYESDRDIIRKHTKQSE